ncbi:MAG TPA: TetR/AcrR family transcriptional regulator [Sulfurovum sp.]|nr:MAG: TetR family transcriptional regulator [Sulfurovum sp. 35-42-20]OYY54454.1 MAG: TetR family transcriptional regulator [Sulfurovum sp. 28-43-6]OYZ26156.1 MAG: TetR family transcriptional regulator [Sulfurovum sp. 16-42-52]OZA46194.1 MAG: TetR family transcriptional regulator [Sulfurovum sp. 17-42-90]OZA61391.1 MAG: TetR family transcriptional regulator [Sulfurovum sp. 39-42-12]HQR74719.1 TetR/AcrR family transcriptional regulator [Sulfurovum sp.]
MHEQSVISPPSKGSKTKEKILKTALGLFAVKGYSATTVRDIAGAMDVKQSALYNHFKNKDEILETLVSELTTSAIVTLFADKESVGLHRQGKSLLMSIATTFKLIGFDGPNEALVKLLMQEIFRNERIREIYNEYFYQENVKKLSGIFFAMMQDEMIKSSDPLLLANEFFSPLFFYQMQVSLLKLDKKSTSSVVSLFEKHVDYFWDTIKLEKQQTLF